MCSFESSSKLYVVVMSTVPKLWLVLFALKCTDLAFAGNTLHGVSFTKFLTLNPTTGKVTASKSHGFADLNALVAGSAAGTFYGTGLYE